MKEEQRKALDKLMEEFAESTFGPPPIKEELKKLRKKRDEKKAASQSQG